MILHSNSYIMDWLKINEVSLIWYLVFISSLPKNAETLLQTLKSLTMNTILKFMTDTSQLWYSPTRIVATYSKTPVESYLRFERENE